jgi:hypothetical protein
MAAVNSGRIPFVRINYPPKVFVRATKELRIAFGYHGAEGTSGPLVPLEAGEVLHAPIRSFANLRRRMEAGRRTHAVTPGADQNWHLKRVAAMDEAALAAEWRRNAFSPLRPGTPGESRLDFRLARIGLAQSGFRPLPARLTARRALSRPG